QRKTAQNSNRKAAARVSLPYLISTMSMNKTELNSIRLSAT
ncbi:hypothetical protein ABIE63_002777, partial [Limibacillus sp. MBR-115]